MDRSRKRNGAVLSLSQKRCEANLTALRWSRRRLKLFGRLIIGLTCFSLCCPISAERSMSKEEKIKAAYLVNFTRYIEWPNTGSANLTPKIRICVKDSDGYVEFLRELASDKRFVALPYAIEVLRLRNATGCELLYVGRLKTVLDMQLDNTVIVADSGSVAFSGIAIKFYREKSKLRFEIDLDKIGALNVVVGSELLKLARIKP
jgi:hypothetical protein